MSNERIGCSLADATSSPKYMDYLAAAAASVPSPSLHVVYINTSLETKAYTHEVVPTITCTAVPPLMSCKPFCRLFIFVHHLASNCWSIIQMAKHKGKQMKIS